MSARYHTTKVRLNKSGVEALQPPDNGVLVAWDDLLRPFHVRVTPKGTKTYYVRGRPPGSRLEGDIKIGRHGHITAEIARTRAKHMLGQLAAGQDPRPPRRKDLIEGANRAERRRILFGDLCDLYLTHEHRNRDISLASRKGVDRWFEAYIKPELGHIPVPDLAAPDLREFHQRHQHHPHTANQMLIMVSSVCSWAEPEYREPNTNPCWTLVNGVKRWVVQFYPTKLRERRLSDEELQRIAIAIQVLQSKNRLTAVEADFFRLKLLTGCRSSELYRLKWIDVHLEQRYFELPQHKSRKKTGERRYVALSDAAVLLIDRQPRVSEYVFWNPAGASGTPNWMRRAGPLTIRRLEYIWGGQAWRGRAGYRNNRKDYQGRTVGIRDLAGLGGDDPVKLHDFRHTSASLGGAEANLNAHLLCALFGWKNLEQAKRYVHPPMAPLIAGANAIADNLLSSGLIGPDLATSRNQSNIVAELEQQLAAALAEIARLKGVKGS